MRYPVILSLAEKEISRRISLGFKQFVCGFDILRVQGKSYVCDVNGWSFVKNSRKYYDDASEVLVGHILTELRPAHSRTASPRLIQSVEARERRPSTTSGKESYDGTDSVCPSVTSQSSLAESGQAAAAEVYDGHREELRSGMFISSPNS